jgi:hypothetical protein
VEHPCYKCGSPVEDGTAFCPQCGAAQIRVANEEVPRAGEPVEVQTSCEPVVAAGIQWSKALPAAALAGLIAAGLMLIPLGAFGLGMISAGVLAVLFYRRRHPGVTLSPGMGARLGVVSGALGFGIFSVFIAIEMLVFHSGGELRAALLEKIEQSALGTSDPQAQQVVTYLKSPSGLALIIALGLVATFFLFLIFSSLGGTLAATLLRRRERS